MKCDVKLKRDQRTKTLSKKDNTMHAQYALAGTCLETRLFQLIVDFSFLDDDPLHLPLDASNVFSNLFLLVHQIRDPQFIVRNFFVLRFETTFCLFKITAFFLHTNWNLTM